MTISRIPLTPGRNRQRGQPQHIDLAFISGKIELILIALDDLVHKAILQRLLCGQPPARLQNIKNIIYLFVALGRIHVRQYQIELVVLQLVLLQLIDELLDLVSVILPPGIHPVAHLVHQEQTISGNAHLFRTQCGNSSRTCHQPIQVGSHVSMINKLLTDIQPVINRTSQRGDADIDRLAFQACQLIADILLGVAPTANVVIYVQVIGHITFLIAILHYTLYI